VVALCREPGGPQLAVGPRGPWPGTQAFERVQRRGQVLAGQGSVPRAAQPLAVGKLDPGEVEGPAVGAGGGECLAEQGCGMVVGRGDGGRSTGQQGDPWRDRRDTRVAHGGDVSSGISAAASPHSGLDDVHADPQGERHVGRQYTRRADRAGLVVGRLVITPAQRHEHARVVTILQD
jgi:hypothetical protein